MSVENGVWIMRGLDWNDPYRIRTWQELVNCRREGYDFDSRYQDGLASRREKKIMDFFITGDVDGDPVFKDEFSAVGGDIC